MILNRAAILTITCLIHLSSIAMHNAEYVSVTLKPIIEKDINSLQWALVTIKIPWVGMATIQTAAFAQGVAKQCEIDCIPRFKILDGVKIAEFHTWLKQQNDESVYKMLEPVKKYADVESLITWQNETYEKANENSQNPTELTKDQAFERMVQSAHFKHKKTQEANRGGDDD